MILHPPAWSPPSAIGLTGVGVGGQAGAEMTDFLIVFNSRLVSHLPLDPIRAMLTNLTPWRVLGPTFLQAVVSAV